MFFNPNPDFVSFLVAKRNCLYSTVFHISPHRNFFECEKEVNASQYQGVYYHKQTGKWYARLNLQGQKQKWGGYFNDELDAAKKLNQICEELEIPLQNPGITGMPNQQVLRFDEFNMTT